MSKKKLVVACLVAIFLSLGLVHLVIFAVEKPNERAVAGHPIQLRTLEASRVFVAGPDNYSVLVEKKGGWEIIGLQDFAIHAVYDYEGFWADAPRVFAHLTKDVALPNKHVRVDYLKVKNEAHIYINVLNPEDFGAVR